VKIESNKEKKRRRKNSSRTWRKTVSSWTDH